MCSLAERLGDVRARVVAAGWDACVVVSQDRVVLGLLRAKELQADPGLPVEQVMRPGPSTYRPFVSVEEMRRIMTDRDLENSPVTTSDGKLVGLVRRQDVGIYSPYRSRRPTPARRSSYHTGMFWCGPVAFSRLAGRRGARRRSG